MQTYHRPTHLPPSPSLSRAGAGTVFAIASPRHRFLLLPQLASKQKGRKSEEGATPDHLYQVMRHGETLHRVMHLRTT